LLVVNKPRMQIHLPVELCHISSLPDDFTKDDRKMKAIDQYKVKDVDKRMQKITDIVDKIFNVQAFSEFNIEIDR